MAGKTMKNKCARGFDHILDPEPVKKTKTHIIKQCKRCKGHFWQIRRS